jgi:hypothetical protein
MTTWPSTTKASTTNVDAGTDQISLARADIKQNIDNVNDIIDIFDIASPTNGDLIKYNSSTTKWEKVASTAVGSTVKAAQISFSTGQAISGGYRHLISLSGIQDAYGIITLSDSNYRFALTAGTYQFCNVNGSGTANVGSVTNNNIYNYTDSVDLLTFTVQRDTSPGPAIILPASNFQILTSTKTLELRTSGSQRNGFDTMVVIKLS